MASITFNQATLSPPGVSNRSRSDGLSGGQLVTITTDVPGTVTFVDVPPDDTSAVSSLASTSSTTWTFNPTVGVYGSWLVQLVPTNPVIPPVRRLFAVRTPNKALRIPGFNEKANVNATLATGGTFVTDSDNNEGNSYRGWSESLTQVYEMLDNTNNFFIKDYGAVCDGVHDDTAAFDIAYQRAAALPGGGNVVLSHGSTRITSKRLFDASTDGNNPAPVFIVGMNAYPSILLWDPTIVSEDFIHYQGAGGLFYFGGGIKNVAIISANPLASGRAIRVKQCFNMQFSSLWIRGFLGGGTGTGFCIQSGDDPNDPSQHIDLDNVMLQGNCIGLNASGVADCTMRKMMVNQNTVRQARIGSGTFQWEGGLVQGGGVTGVEFSPGAGEKVTFNQIGCHYEVVGAPSCVANEAPGGTYSGSISISNVDNSGDGTFLTADHYTVRLANIASDGAVVVGDLVECGLTAIDCSALPAEWDLDAFTLANATFINGGHASYGRLPSSPFTVPLSASFGQPISLASLTQTQRNALSGVADGWQFFNSSARRNQTYVSGRTKPWVCDAPEDAKEIFPALLTHFSALRGAGATSGWADMIGNYVLAPTGAPKLEADGKNFNGVPVWKLLLASSNLLDSGGSGATLFTAGTTELYVRILARRTVALVSSFGTYLNLTNNAANLIMAQLMDNADDGAWEGAFDGGRTNFGPPPVQDFLPHKFELHFSPTETLLSLDGVPISDAGPLTPLAQPIQRICLGGFPGFGFNANVNICDVKIGSTRPTGDAALALNEMDYNLYGIG
jgi:hypothetical protein